MNFLSSSICRLPSWHPVHTASPLVSPDSKPSCMIASNLIAIHRRFWLSSCYNVLPTGENSSSNCPFLSGGCEPRLTRGSLGRSEFTSQAASRSHQAFLYNSPYSFPTLFNGVGHPKGGTPFLPQKCPFRCGDRGRDLIHGSLGSPDSIFQTASRSVQPFQHSSWSLPTVTDSQTMLHR